MHRVGGLDAAEFGQVGLTEHDQRRWIPVCATVRSETSAIRSLKIGVPAGGSDAADVVVVLDDDGQSAQQRVCPARRALSAPCGLFARPAPGTASAAALTVRLDDGDASRAAASTSSDRRHLAVSKQEIARRSAPS